MNEITKEEAEDFILDCYNVIKALKKVDSSVWEPIHYHGDVCFSCIDGRVMTEEEIMRQHPSGTFP